MDIDERMLAAGLAALKSELVGDKMMDDISVAERVSIVSEIYKAMSDAAPKPDPEKVPEEHTIGFKGDFDVDKTEATKEPVVEDPVVEPPTSEPEKV